MVCFLQVAVTNFDLCLLFEILFKCLIILGFLFKSGGLRSRSKGLNLWLGLLGMDFTVCDVAGPLEEPNVSIDI